MIARKTRPTPRASIGLSAHPKNVRGWSMEGLQGGVEYVQGMLSDQHLGNAYERNPIFNIGIDAIWSGFSRMRLQWWDGEPDDKESERVQSKDAPLASLMAAPRRGMSYNDFWQCCVTELKGCGSIYWFAVNKSAKPVGVNFLGGITEDVAQLLPVPERLVKQEWKGGRLIGYRYKSRGENTTTESAFFPAASVIPIRNYRPTDPSKGLGAQEVLTDELTIWANAAMGLANDLAATDGGAFFVYEDADLSPEQAEEQQDRLDDLAEDENRFKALFGNPKIYQNLVKPSDKEYLPTRAAVRSTILAKIGVPENVLGWQDNATYENLRTALRIFWIGPLGIVALGRVLAGGIETLQSRLVTGRVLTSPLVAHFSAAHIKEAREDVSEDVERAAKVAATGVGVSYNQAMADMGAEIEPAPDGDRRFIAAKLQQIVDDPDAEDPEPIYETLSAQQATVIQTVLENVRIGKLTVDTAQAFLATAFPRLNPEGVAEMLAGVEVVEESEAPIAEEEATPKEPSKLAVGEIEIRAAGDLVKPDPGLKAATLTWQRQYEKALFAKWARFAKTPSTSKKASGMVTERAVGMKASDWKFLLLSENLWAQKMGTMTLPATKRLWRQMLSVAAKEVGGGILNITDPAVVKVYSEQTLVLGHFASEATEAAVREVVLSHLAGVTTGTPLTEAIKEVLPAMRASFRSKFGGKEVRALKIARTETGKAQNTARFMQYDDAGVDELEWRASTTGDVRDSHAAQSGTRVKLGQAFPNGLRHPHEPGAPGGEVINCRCRVIGHFIDTEDDE